MSQVLADIRAEVWLSTAGTDFKPARIILGADRVIFAFTEADSHTLTYASIFDIATEYVPPHIETSYDGHISIGFTENGTRHTGTIAGPGETMDDFATVLLTSLLSSVEVITTWPKAVDDDPCDPPPATAVLEVKADRISVTGADIDRTVSTTQLIGFTRRGADGPGRRTAVGIHYHADDRRIQAEITFECPGKANIFGRYLQTAVGQQPKSREEITVLFVDDEPGLPELLGSKLRRRSDRFTAVYAEDGLEGLDRLEEHPDIDCVVSDYKMPLMNGIEFLRAVRSVRPNLPFILFTGRGSEAVAEEALAAGVTDYIRKRPAASRLEDLAARVEQAVSEQRPHTTTIPASRRTSASTG